MEPKVIITIVLIAFIIGGIIFLQVRNKFSIFGGKL